MSPEAMGLAAQPTTPQDSPVPDWAIVGMISILVIVGGVALMRFFRRGTAGVPRGQEGASDPFTAGAADPFKTGNEKRMSVGLQVVIVIFLIFIAWAACTASQAQV
jgi:hypothetical protein